MDSVIVPRNRILQTKFFRPPTKGETVLRTQLLERLNSYLDRQLIIVHAPAGYGKSTLVSQWFDASEVPVAWLSLDEYDRDPESLVAYIMAAVAEVFPELGDNTRSLLSSPQDIPLNVLADSLISDLEDLPAPLLLALDDFHELADSDAEDVVERLIQYMPPELHLVLTCRARPHLALSRLAMTGQLGEITAADLRFQESEAAVLVSALARRPVDKATTARLEQRTEGWVTALQLAGLSLRGKSDMNLDRVLEVEDSDLLLTYLIEEVARQIPEKLVDFMLRTSILNRFSAELCAAVVYDAANETGSFPDAAATIQQIRDANLFLISLDERQVWYRYHHLFRQVLHRELEAQLGSAEIAALHLRASAWFESAGMIEDAIRHAMAAGDSVAAAQVAERHYHELLDEEDPLGLERWLSLLPERVRDRPIIMMMQAWRDHFGWRILAAADRAKSVEGCLDSGVTDLNAEQAEQLYAESYVLHAQLAAFRGEPEALQLAMNAFERISPESVFAGSLAQLYVALGMQSSGEAIAAAAYVREQLELGKYQPNARTFRLLLALGGIDLYEGNLTGLQVTARIYDELAVRSGNRLNEAWAKWLLGCVAYERNDLATAEVRFGEVVQLRLYSNGKAAAEAFMGLVLTLLNSGRLDEAEATLERFRAHLVETNSLGLMPLYGSLVTRVNLARQASGAGLPPVALAFETPEQPRPKIGFMELPHATAARVLLVEGSPHALQRALELLQAAHDVVTKTFELRRLVELNTLLALVWAALGDETQALAHLRSALAQGQAEGYVRSIVDNGPQLGPLLSKVRDQGEFVGYIDGLIQALANPSVVENVNLEILLTNREMDVLERLVLRRSNKEIATELYLSPLTVKRHTQTLFRKLGATNRREAVVLARQQGLSI